MPIGFSNYNSTLDAPARYWAAVTPANADLPNPCRALWIGTGGDVVVQCEAGEGYPATTATFKNVPAGFPLPVRALRVLPTTTASDIVALW